MKFVIGLLMLVASATIAYAGERRMPSMNNVPVQCPAKPPTTSPATTCTHQYNPVCGLIKVGRDRVRRVTYSSACLACNTSNVVSYTLGPCR